MHFHWEGAEQSGGKKDSLKINEDVCDEKKFYLQQKKYMLVENNDLLVQSLEL